METLEVQRGGSTLEVRACRMYVHQVDQAEVLPTVTASAAAQVPVHICSQPDLP